MTCIVRVDNYELDIELIYRDKGFTTLPPALTLSGLELKTLADAPANYALFRDIPGEVYGRSLPDAEAVVLKDCDGFFTTPPAFSRGPKP